MSFSASISLLNIGHAKLGVAVASKLHTQCAGTILSLRLMWGPRQPHCGRSEREGTNHGWMVSFARWSRARRVIKVYYEAQKKDVTAEGAIMMPVKMTFDWNLVEDSLVRLLAIRDAISIALTKTSGISCSTVKHTLAWWSRRLSTYPGKTFTTQL